MPISVAAPTWASSSTAAVRQSGVAALPATVASSDAPGFSGQTASHEPPITQGARTDAPVAEPPSWPVLPTVQSPDGRFVLTTSHLTVQGQVYSLRTLERAEVQHVRWVLWVLLGGLGLASVAIGFLQNWLHTLPAAAGLLAFAGLLAYGQRGTNRLRLWRLGQEPAHAALPGELATWQRLVAELNRRIARAHDQAAAEAAALLATLVPPAPPAPEL